MSRFAISGTSSGLGKYLKKNLNSYKLHRNLKNINIINKNDTIIHCAFNKKKEIKYNELFNYYSDNFLFTSNLLKTKHRKFIYISSIDVYNDIKIKKENKNIDYNINSIYSFSKALSESLIQNLTENFLILRVSSILSQNMKQNNITRIINNGSKNITVSENSVYNFVLASDILNFINFAVKNDLKGIYNLSSSKNIKLSSICRMFNKKISYGNFFYNCGNINQDKTRKITNIFNKTSREILKNFFYNV